MRYRIIRLFPILASAALAACSVKEAPNTAATDTGSTAKAVAPAAATANVVHVTAKDYAGDYVLVCFFPDAKDGKPHFVHGMVQSVKVT